MGESHDMSCELEFIVVPNVHCWFKHSQRWDQSWKKDDIMCNLPETRAKSTADCPNVPLFFWEVAINEGLGHPFSHTQEAYG